MSQKIKITAQDLRDRIADIISQTIDVHRGSRELQEENYEKPSGPPTEEEVTDFVMSNALFDEETVWQLIDPGLLGFSANVAKADISWISEFTQNVEQWASINAWLAADEPIWATALFEPQPSETKIWKPPQPKPGWVDTSPTSLLLAFDLIRGGKLLSEMNWRDFEKLVGLLLENEGWSVVVTQPTRDGGIDLIAEKEDSELGKIQSLWQAKKYATHRKVRLNEVRELSAIRNEKRATKGIIVTTSHLTRDALAWIQRDIYRLGFKDKEGVEGWVKKMMGR